MRKALVFLVLLSATAFAAGAISVETDGVLGSSAGLGVFPLGVYSPMTQGDGAGYYFWDSTETDLWAPNYAWRTPSHPQGWQGDDTYWITSLPFAVTFCGIRHTAGSNFYVGSNGILGFAAASMSEPINQNIPVSTAPNAIIAVFWDNLAGYVAGSISLDLVGSEPDRAWFISYSPWFYDLAPSDPIEFQVLIRETDVAGINNTIEFRYKDVVGDSWRDNGFSATVGLENNSGTTAAKYSYNQEVIPNQFAIRFVDKQYVDSQIGRFHLIIPEDGYVGEVGEEIVFRWQEPEYTGEGVVTYELYLADNEGFDDARIFDTGTNPTLSYIFGSDDTGTYWWKVKATESVLGLYEWSEETNRLIISDVAVQDTTWGQIKATFE